jgi:hypothetical protein
MIVAILLMLSFQSFSQLTIVTNYRQDGVWDTSAEQWNVLSTDDDETVFSFNKDLTEFHHKTATIESDYFISKWDYDEENVRYTMTVTSDAGNDYEMIVDGINNCVAFFYYYGDDYVMVRHTIETTDYKE